MAWPITAVAAAACGRPAFASAGATAMAPIPITKSRPPTCPTGRIDPYKQFQQEITVTAELVTLKAKNVTLNPPQKLGFQAKKDPLKQSF